MYDLSRPGISAALGLLLTAIVAGPAPAETLEVDAAGSTPFLTIQSAIDAASPGVDQVHVHCGTYLENLTLRDGVSVVGSGAACTTVDGSGVGPVVTAIGVGAATRWEGFLVRNGAAANGGGIYIEDSSLQIVGGIVEANVAQGAPPEGDGGGIFVTEIGGISAPRISGTVIRGNLAATHGGGVAVRQGSGVTLSSNLFESNTAGFAGGAIHLADDASSIVGNTLVFNCLQSGGPVCTAGGGAIYIAGGMTPELLNNVIAWNESATGGGVESNGLPFVFRHNDTLGNVPVDFAGMPDPLGIDGNLSIDPRFDDQLTYALRSDSPLVDTGEPVPGLERDLRGLARPADGDGSGTHEFDIGARESEGLTRLVFDTPDTLSWDGSSDPAAVFEVYRGDLQLMRDQGAYLQDPLLVGAAMRWCDLSQPQLIDGILPDSGQTLFYLAGARNWGAVTLGFASSLIERIDDPAQRCNDPSAPVVTVDPLITLDTSPPLGGALDDPSAAVEVTVDGQFYAADNDGSGRWSLADDAIGALAVGTYDVAVSATDAAGNNGVDSTSAELEIAATGVVQLTLMDADSDLPIGPLFDGQMLNLDDLPTSNLSVRADTQPATVGSVVFDLDGNPGAQIESVAPYALFGDSGGDFAPWDGILIGQHDLIATPYSGSGGSGTAGVPLGLSFRIIGGAGFAWESRSAAPLARYEAQGLAVDDRLYVFGGFYTNDGGPTTTLEAHAYEPAADDWTQLADVPELLTHAGQVADGTRVYIGGGFVGDHPGGSTTHVWIYDTVLDSWSVGPDLPADRGGGGLARLGRTLHYFGGATRTAGINVLTDFGDHWTLDLGPTSDPADDATVWTPAATLPNPRNHMGAAAIAGLVYAIGGQHGGNEDSGNQTSIHAYDPVGDSWTPVADMPRPLGHVTASTFEFNGWIVVIGGVTNGSTKVADVIAYDPGTDTWVALPDIPGTRQSPVAGVIADQLVVTGGSSGGITTTTWIGDLLDGWETAPALPAALGEVACGVVGNKLYVVGEGDGATLAYDLSLRAWEPLGNLAARPLQGHHHAAEVHDGKLYLIGGLHDGSPGKLQIYDPGTDLWTTGADIPFAAGSGSSALIDGKIYFAGGIIGSATTNQAAVYDPALDSWSMLAPMPQGVNHAASATDGSRLFVFGGRTGGNTVSNGFDYVQAYDPGSDTWDSSEEIGSPLSPLPQARGGMGKATYFEGEFYVLGGETATGSGATVDGVYDRVDIYDPLTHGWRQGPEMLTAMHGIFPILHAGRIHLAGGGIKAANSQSTVCEIYTPQP